MDDLEVAEVERLRDVVAALEAENASLRAALHQDRHVLIFAADGWALEHLVACRPVMSDCRYHQAVVAAATSWDGQPVPLGRYDVSLDATGGAVIGSRLSHPTSPV